MNGINQHTGKPLGGLDHLRQSVEDILTTPIGSRVMRREYGSNVFRLVDRPITPGLLVELYACAIDALSRWEPRLRIKTMTGAPSDPAGGWIVLTIEGQYLLNGQPVRLEGIQL